MPAHAGIHAFVTVKRGVKKKKETSFLKKRSKKLLVVPGRGAAILWPLKSRGILKVFWLLFFKKVTAFLSFRFIP